MDQQPKEQPKETWRSILFVIVIAAVALGCVAWHFHDREKHGHEMYQSGHDDAFRLMNVPPPERGAEWRK